MSIPDCRFLIEVPLSPDSLSLVSALPHVGGRANLWRRYAIAALLLCLVAARTTSAADAIDPVRALPDLAKATTWQVRTGDDAILTPGDGDPFLLLRFNADAKNVAQVLLKTPLAIPEDATGFTFLCAPDNSNSGLKLFVLVKDATGQELRFHTRSNPSYEEGLFFPEHHSRRCRFMRFQTPGLERPDLRPRDGTINSTKPQIAPKKPYTLLGVELVGEHQNPKGSFTELLFQEFKLTRLSRQNTARHYQFKDEACYAELDPLPTLTGGDLMSWDGDYRVTWEVRDRYEAPPFLAGGKSFVARTARDRKPLTVQLAEKFEIPVTEEGTYWVRVRFLRVNPQETFEEREFRLCVDKGDQPAAHTPLPLNAKVVNSFIRVLPQHSVVFTPDEKFELPVVFEQPTPDATDLGCEIVVSTYGLRREVKSVKPTPQFDANGRFAATVDLSDLQAGAYIASVTLTQKGKLVDRVTRVIGRQAALPPVAELPPIPESVPSAEQLLTRPRPMFHLSPMLPPDILTETRTRWTLLKGFIDQMRNSPHKEMEYPADWSAVEPLPGVYDFEEIDRVLDYAREAGITVLLFPGIRSEPEWLPSVYTRNKEGSIFGHNTYLFHGARLNLFHPPAVRQAALNLVANMGARYRMHPAVQGYHFLIEHPGEAPYVGWREGYGKETIENFSRHCRAQWPNLETLNARWGTQLKDIEAIAPPEDDATSRYWLDWMQFRTRAIDSFLEDCALAVRRFDNRRLIILYADFYTLDAAKLKKLGCALANGGSHDLYGIPHYSAVGYEGLQERTEDHSPGQWTGYFPTQLDASVFAMLSGGGGNTHCKAYTYTRLPSAPERPLSFDDLRKPPYSLDRYEKFMPIWTELRQTGAPEYEVFSFRDMNSYLATVRTTYPGWFPDAWRMLAGIESHVPMAGANERCRANAKLIVPELHATVLDAATHDRLVRFVENGGVLLMPADTGSGCVEKPGEQWVLLRRFGFAPPTAEPIKDRYTKTVSVPGEIFGPEPRTFILRETWDVPPPADAHNEAFFDGDAQRPALSWKPFGKGRVAVLWAQVIVPPTKHGENYPMLRDVARWAGAKLPYDASNPNLWLNLLKHREKECYYGLAYAAADAEGLVKWQLPEGTYRMTELISGADTGTFSASDLWSKGMKVKLGARAVAIYRIEKQ